MADETLSPTPPENEEDRAIWMIRRVFKAATGEDMSLAEATTAFNTARDKLQAAMASATAQEPTP